MESEGKLGSFLYVIFFLDLTPIVQPLNELCNSLCHNR